MTHGHRLSHVCRVLFGAFVAAFVTPTLHAQVVELTPPPARGAAV